MLNDTYSDHHPILTHYNFGNVWRNISTNKPKWNLNKANWPRFTSLCKELKIEEYKSNNIDKYNDKIILFFYIR